MSQGVPGKPEKRQLHTGCREDYVGHLTVQLQWSTWSWALFLLWSPGGIWKDPHNSHFSSYWSLAKCPRVKEKQKSRTVSTKNERFLHTSCSYVPILCGTKIMLSWCCRHSGMTYSWKNTASSTWADVFIRPLLLRTSCWEQNQQRFHHVSCCLFLSSSIKSSSQTVLEFQ